MASLAEPAKLKEQENLPKSTVVVTMVFTPFWNIKEGESANFPPDAMQITHFSGRTRLSNPFAGVVNDPS